MPVLEKVDTAEQGWHIVDAEIFKKKIHEAIVNAVEIKSDNRSVDQCGTELVQNIYKNTYSLRCETKVLSRWIYSTHFDELRTVHETYHPLPTCKRVDRSTDMCLNYKQRIHGDMTSIPWVGSHVEKSKLEGNPEYSYTRSKSVYFGSSSSTCT